MGLMSGLHADRDDRIPRLFSAPTDRRIATLAWIGAAAASFVLIALVGFTSADPDSRVYAGISARLAAEPFDRWIAPDWWGLWNFTGPFREHPIGILVLPALIGRIGYPAHQAAYAVNGLFQLVSIVLVQMIAAHLVRPREARALGWIVQVMPIAFVFRVRANQEYAVLAGVLLALLATERSYRRPAWASVTALAFAWTLLVKGIFGFVVPITCGVWLAVRTWVERGAHATAARERRGLRSVSCCSSRPCSRPCTRYAYVRATGDSFLAFYMGPRLNPGAVTAGALERVGYNTIWYTGRLAWYAFPWSLAGLAAFAAWVVSRRRRKDSGRADATPPGERDTRGLLFAVTASVLLIVLFSFSDRKADRFIFPAYYFIAGAGGVAAIRYSPLLSRMVNRLDRPWVPAACWMALFLLRLITGSHLPQFTFWRS